MKEFRLKYWNNNINPIIIEYNMEFRNLSEAYKYIQDKQCIAISVKPITNLNKILIYGR